MKKLLACLCLCLLLTGCKGPGKESVANLLKAPQLSQRENEILALLTEELGQTVVLKYPKQGENIRPVHICDLNSDGVQEAVVFYNLPGQGGYVQMAVISMYSSGWRLQYTAEGNGSEVYSIGFETLLPGLDKQIAVGYTFGDSSEKILTVYYTRQASVTGEEAYACQNYAIGDVTGDGRSDIVLAGLNADNQPALLQVLTAEYSAPLQAVASAPLPATNARVTGLAIGDSRLSDNPAIVVDYADTNHLVHTTAVSFRPAAEDDPRQLAELLSPDVVVKGWEMGYPLNSIDADGNGTLETPTVVDYPHCARRDIKVMEWTDFLDLEPKRRFIGLCHPQNGVFFPIPDEWQNHFSVAESRRGGWSVNNLTTGEEIVRFEFVSTQNSDKEEGYTVKYVGVGVQLIKFSFSQQVSYSQQEYITSNLLFIK